MLVQVRRLLYCAMYDCFDVCAAEKARWLHRRRTSSSSSSRIGLLARSSLGIWLLFLPVAQCTGKRHTARELPEFCTGKEVGGWP